MAQTERQFIRHPSEIPLEYCLTQSPSQCSMDYVRDISTGGLSFHSQQYLEPEQWVHIFIPVDENYFEADAQVRWCRASGKGHDFDVGVCFSNPSEAFSARMVEQVCYIEKYKKNIWNTEGRQLSSDEAAAEWITKFADEFPPISTEATSHQPSYNSTSYH